MVTVRTTIVGVIDAAGNRPVLEWPTDWPVPRVGDEVEVDSRTLVVRTVVWYPTGDDEGPLEPFVYVVIGPARP